MRAMLLNPAFGAVFADTSLSSGVDVNYRTGITFCMESELDRSVCVWIVAHQFRCRLNGWPFSAMLDSLTVEV